MKCLKCKREYKTTWEAEHCCLFRSEKRKGLGIFGFIVIITLVTLWVFILIGNI